MSWVCDIEDGPKVYSWTEPIARQEYTCCECKNKISKGEKYFKVQGLWDGKWDVFRQHLRCLKACHYIRDILNHGECIAFGGLLEWYEDCKDWLRRMKKDEKVKTLRNMLARIV